MRLNFLFSEKENQENLEMHEKPCQLISFQNITIWKIWQDAFNRHSLSIA
jgi:hypothetical protein